MRLDSRLENLVAHADIVNDQLYELKDAISERTYLECFTKNQERLRELGYKHVAMAYLLMNGTYQTWRMNHPFDAMTKPRYWIEGNIIHKR